MAASQQVPHHIQLDEALASENFGSWQLGQGAIDVLQPTNLPSSLAHPASYGNGFLRTRTALLHNNLHELESGDIFCFLRQGESSDIRLHRIAQDAKGPILQYTGVQLRICEPHQRNPEICQAPSVVRVGGEQTLLLTSGAGDLVLAAPRGTQFVHSAVIEPIKCNIAAVSFVLAAAAPSLGGGIEAVAWAIQDKEGVTPAHVQIYSLHLSVAVSPEKLEVKTLSSSLLAKAAVPPHLAVIDPASSTILLAIDPGEGLGDTGTSQEHRTHLARVEDDEDAPSPRTLAAAFERLRRFTSETENEAMSSGEPFVDVFSERSEPTAPATEADCEVLLFDRASVEAGESTPPLQKRSCRPHKFLAARGTSVGLATDVDCSVVQAAPKKEASPVPLINLQHLHTIPALAYIAEGKSQRKYILLGWPGGSVAAVIVEAFKYAYVYFATPPNAKRGSHLIVDMALPEGSPGALGAALVPAAGGCRLLVLTANQLLAWNITA